MMPVMWPYHHDLLAAPVPRYTSYPTAMEFTEHVGAHDLDDALDATEEGASVSLYVHIPFCRDICWYCGCNTGRANRTQRLTAYLDALLREVWTLADRMAGRVKVARIAFGGGSPNALKPVEFVRLADALILAFGARAPTLSVELDPRSLDPGWALALGATGASRVSLGVQTFDPAAQRAIGRVQPLEMIVGAVERLRARRVSSINFDLMYGLPNQDRDSLADTLEQAIALKPDRIALFGYAHVPHILPRQRRIDAASLPDQAERFAMAAYGYDRLVDAGYVPVGFDHFALPGDALAIAAKTGRLRRNFQGFTEDTSDILLGLGASAISSFPHMLVQNEKNSGRYRDAAAAGKFSACKGVRRSPDDQARARIIEDLLCGRAADIGTLEDDGFASERLARFVDRGLALQEGGRIAISQPGLPYARTIAAVFDQYRSPSARLVASAI